MALRVAAVVVTLNLEKEVVDEGVSVTYSYILF